MAIEESVEDRSQSESKLDELNSSISSMSREDMRIRPELRAPLLMKHSIGIIDRIRSDHKEKKRVGPLHSCLSLSCPLLVPLVSEEVSGEVTREGEVPGGSADEGAVRRPRRVPRS